MKQLSFLVPAACALLLTTLWQTLLPTIVQAAPWHDTNQRGLLGPIVVVAVVILLNILLVAFAVRLRRYFLHIAEQNKDELPRSQE